MFNNIRNKIYNEIRERTSRYLLGNIGDVVDLGDELVCYVDKKKCDNWGYDYHINCVGINDGFLLINNEKIRIASSRKKTFMQELAAYIGEI